MSVVNKSLSSLSALVWRVHSSPCPRCSGLAGCTPMGATHSRKFLQHWSCFWTHSNSLSIASKAPETRSFHLPLNQFLQSINVHFICLCLTQSNTVPPPLYSRSLWDSSLPPICWVQHKLINSGDMNISTLWVCSNSFLSYLRLGKDTRDASHSPFIFHMH